jgi:hypothetical protein
MDSWENIEVLSQILMGDVRVVIDRGHREQTDRRAYVRAVFACIEGLTYTAKQTILEDFPKSLASAETALIKEETFDLDDKGSPKVRPLFIQLAKNVRFTFSLLARFREVPVTLKVDGLGWQSFLTAIEIRNRVMHPKCVGDLSITDDELKSVCLAYRWYVAHYTLLLTHQLSDVLWLIRELATCEGMPDEKRQELNEWLSKGCQISEEEVRKIHARYANVLIGL